MTSPHQDTAITPLPTRRPENIDELATTLRDSSDAEESLAILGGGTHRWMGTPPQVDAVVETRGLAGIKVFEPDDLTVVVGGGTTLADLEAQLAEGAMTAVLPETDPDATVGGVVASGASGYRRARYGPTRDRMLEVTAVTGDGRIVRAGGRVVKNVTGYDLPRLYTGSFGSLGVIESVCLKLWPLPERMATVEVDDPERVSRAHRPLAVLDVSGRTRVMLLGTASAVEAEAGRLGGSVADGLDWPERPVGGIQVEVRVPPAHLPEVVTRLDGDYIAQVGVGVIETSIDSTDALADLRADVESWGGVVVVEGGHDIDPWGTPPPTLDLQRQMIAQFDPRRILEPGRLPGGL